MPCDFIRTPTGAAIVCRRGPRPAPCYTDAPPPADETARKVREAVGPFTPGRLVVHAKYGRGEVQRSDAAYVEVRYNDGVSKTYQTSKAAAFLRPLGV